MSKEMKNNEGHAIPPVVDFSAIADNAVTKGLFLIDKEAQRKNKKIRKPLKHLPDALLSQPYPNGPMVILQWEVDIAHEASAMVRRNFIEANKLLLPQDQVLAYFHHRFVKRDVINSASLSKQVEKFKPNDTREVKPSDKSFQIDSAKRRTTNRHLFTEEEIIESLEFSLHHPKAILTVLAYKSVILDFLHEIENKFQQRSVYDSSITDKGLSDFVLYTRQWESQNFSDEIIPALSIFVHRKLQENPDLSEDELITSELFTEAVNFTMVNGAFRHWVTVSDSIASDGNERVMHFVCPAVGKIREQLIDGNLLGLIYAQMKKDENKNEVEPLESSIKESVIKSLLGRKKPRKSYDQEFFNKWLEETSHITFTANDQEYQLTVTDEVLKSFQEKQKKGDTVLDMSIGSLLYNQIAYALNEVAFNGKPVSFDFNGENYRFDSQTLKRLMEESTKKQKG